MKHAQILFALAFGASVLSILLVIGSATITGNVSKTAICDGSLCVPCETAGCDDALIAGKVTLHEPYSFSTPASTIGVVCLLGVLALGVFYVRKIL
ncbi:MAG: hypothetical protein ABIH41_07120 [Nanoarchaeota archaeon]